MNNHENFLKGIENMLLVRITFNSKSKGVITRKCVPYDFGPSNKSDAIDKSPKYQLYDLESPDNSPLHNLPVDPSNVISIELTSERFDPAAYVTWDPPYRWFIARDWGTLS